MWVDSFFKAIGEALGFAKQVTDPEVVRLSKITAIEADLDKERKKLDELLSKEDDNSIDLGLCINRIILLRRKKDGLKR